MFTLSLRTEEIRLSPLTDGHQGVVSESKLKTCSELSGYAKVGELGLSVKQVLVAESVRI